MWKATCRSNRGSRNGTSQEETPPVPMAYDNWSTCMCPRVCENMERYRIVTLQGHLQGFASRI